MIKKEGEKSILGVGIVAQWFKLLFRTQISHLELPVNHSPDLDMDMTQVLGSCHLVGKHRHVSQLAVTTGCEFISAADRPWQYLTLLQYYPG